MAIQTGNSPANPFDHAFEMLGRVPQVTTEEVNADALEKLTQALTARAQDRGRMILLRSPRAGFGKTHLLMRLHQRVAHTHEFIPLEPSKGKELNAQSVLDAVLRRFSRILPAGGGLTVLDLLARRILAAGLEPLVKSGEVPSQDRETALLALQTRPVETFDFHNEEAVTARWAMANFALLGPRLTAELAERTHAGFRPVAWWVELLFRYSSTPVDQTTRNSSLFETVFSSESIETDMHEKLVTLLNLAGLVTSPVLILDEVEGLSSDPAAALQVATFLNALHQSSEKLALIISVNGDVWETAFLPRIPCGLKDRLSDIVVDLQPMDENVAMKMLRDRAGDMAETIADELDFDSGVVYARGVIRCASNAWPEVAVYEDTSVEKITPSEAEPISLIEQENADQIAEHELVPSRKDLKPPKVVIPTGPSVDIETTDEETHEPAAVFIAEPTPMTKEVETKEVETKEVETKEVETKEVEEPVIERLEPVTPDTIPQPFGQNQNTPELGDISLEPTSPFAPAEYTPLTPASEQPVQAEPENPYTPQSTEKEPIQAEPENPYTPQSAEQEPIQAEPENPFAPQSAEQEPVQAEPENPFAPQSAEQVPVELTPETVGEAPENVLESPFNIDTSIPAESPFNQVSPQPEIQPESPAPVLSVITEPSEPEASEPEASAPHSVTNEDHEKVEDLLRQFRDRYGRD